LLYIYRLDKCRILVQFLDTFAKLRKAVITFLNSVVFSFFWLFHDI